MTSTKRYSLTDEHRKQLDSWATLWITNAMSTEAMTEYDKKLCIDAVNRMYRVAKLKPPRHIVFVPSPFVLRFAGGLASWIWYCAKKSNDVRSNFPIHSATNAATHGAACDATTAATRNAIKATTYTVVRDATAAVIRNATDNATDSATDNATSDAVNYATVTATRNVIKATNAATSADVNYTTVIATRNAIKAATYAAISEATSVITSDATAAAIFAATDNATNAATYTATNDATDAMRDATSMATQDTAYRATEIAIKAATGGVSFVTAMNAATYVQATCFAPYYDASRTLYNATYQATLDATEAAARDVTINNQWFVIPQDVFKCADDMKLGAAGLQCARKAGNMWQGGNQWSAWDSFISFFRHIVKLPIDYEAWDAWETLSLHSGPRIVHEDFCMISDRPELLTVDSENRPHADNGPFCRWRDGSALYAYHGVRVPAWVMEHSERITVQHILSEPNAEVRRVMMSRFGGARTERDGIAAFVMQAGAKVLATRGDYSLLELPREDLTSGRMRFIKMTCPSTGVCYLLRVHPDTATVEEGMNRIKQVPPGQDYFDTIEQQT